MNLVFNFEENPSRKIFDLKKMPRLIAFRNFLTKIFVTLICLIFLSWKDILKTSSGFEWHLIEINSLRARRDYICWTKHISLVLWKNENYVKVLKQKLFVSKNKEKKCFRSHLRLLRFLRSRYLVFSRKCQKFIISLIPSHFKPWDNTLILQEPWVLCSHWSELPNVFRCT
jgi:hypothetical protein